MPLPLNPYSTSLAISTGLILPIPLLLTLKQLLQTRCTLYLSPTWRLSLCVGFVDTCLLHPLQRVCQNLEHARSQSTLPQSCVSHNARDTLSRGTVIKPLIPSIVHSIFTKLSRPELFSSYTL
ncbi:hypothetical protein GGR57DRAFT_196918 [Xylariaceae sp. FL1272]|nr:hypothetical protein GGR57DRAFT_196918 [Xylariaceae sp. FL1272]